MIFIQENAYKISAKWQSFCSSVSFIIYWNLCFSFQPSEASMNFMAAVLKADMEDAQTKACGVCLLNVDARPRAKDYEVHKLTYGGRQYHSPCANFWVNCVDLMLPALKIPELLWWLIMLSLVCFYFNCESLSCDSALVRGGDESLFVFWWLEVRLWCLFKEITRLWYLQWRYHKTMSPLEIQPNLFITQ